MKSYWNVLALSSALLAGCEKPPEAGAGEPAAKVDAGAKRLSQVEFQVSKPETFEERVELVGRTFAEKDAVLSAQTAGTVKSIAALGASVKKGQTVAQIAPGLVSASWRQAQAGLQAAEANAALAKDTHDRQKPLFNDGVISALEFQRIVAQKSQAEAQVAQAKALLAQAAEQLSNTRVVAPFSGTIESQNVEVGEQIAPGMPVLRVLSREKMKVRAGVPERYAAEIVRGAPLEVRFENYGFEPRQSEITFVGGAIDDKSRTFTVEAELDNTDGRLKPDMTARLSLVRNTVESALVVPLAAVVRNESGVQIFVVETKDGITTAQSRTVKEGATVAGRTHVAEGLKPGDRVVVSGQQNLTQGERVIAVPQS